MRADDALRQKYRKDVSRGFADQMSLTEQGVVLGAGDLLAKMGDDGLCIEGEEERILTLLAIAYGRDVPDWMLGSLRRASKHWQSGDKSLAAIHLAQNGLGKLDEDGAYRLSLAAELIDAGVAPRELAREQGSNSPPISSNTTRTNRACQPEAAAKAVNGRRGMRLRGATPRR